MSDKLVLVTEMTLSHFTKLDIFNVYDVYLNGKIILSQKKKENS